MCFILCSVLSNVDLLVLLGFMMMVKFLGVRVRFSGFSRYLLDLCILMLFKLMGYIVIIVYVFWFG